MNKKMTIRSQAKTALICQVSAILLWFIILMLVGFSEFFGFILLGYHIIGGLLNKDMANSTIGAIIFAPFYVGRKIALYIQAGQTEDALNELTKEELKELLRNIHSLLLEKKSYKKEDKRNPIVFGCSTFGELEELYELINEKLKSV